MLSTAQSLSPLLHFGTGGRRFFPRVAAIMSSTEVLNKWRNYVSLVYNVYMLQREILFLRIGIYMCTELYTRKRVFATTPNLARLP